MGKLMNFDTEAVHPVWENDNRILPMAIGKGSFYSLTEKKPDWDLGLTLRRHLIRYKTHRVEELIKGNTKVGGRGRRSFRGELAKLD